ncbi:hypothetical protein CLAFUW4_01044 [Fulvia fulva]|uniref:2EXR domain-containing protein n=1 Tax=Passalora fulva TaxID=5499 RepID=A0A9Q8L5N3_PASFU|nr:uncharacterized protein CLAFUR5_01049 [Fulvia fulva]KAK4635652.1 hypothetical protein CLAFUR4_01045 [Fulvia fulva]KAK4638102.1 hypothetical protein CLAFUR0_01046 [Fulvia fulva]UJO11298.1 hypothetical protein CLAFUR5_01049 [Fulvia fulva]WPV08236.1 hypothetical protein CLAFUW4_01044 [Fulvia fulva]WPV24673.1 hypothetical protein CLAFUW7_01049 [Fulvia fulva]
MTSRLLRLPAEIRSLIYEYAVASDKTVVTFRLDPYQRDCYEHAIPPPLALVSHQVRAESLPAYYSCNDFILHTESPQADEAKRWLRLNADHLGVLRRVTFWIRYVPFQNDRASSQGAMAVSIYRLTKGADWQVDNDWRWITVVRKPSELQGDTNFMLEKLKYVAPEISEETATPDDYATLMTDLRSSYIQEKVTS